MFVTGSLLLLGERDTRYRFFAGTVIVHDWATWILVVLVLGTSTSRSSTARPPRPREMVVSATSIGPGATTEKWVATESTSGERPRRPRRRPREAEPAPPFPGRARTSRDIQIFIPFKI